MGLNFRETKKIFGHTQDLNTQKDLELSVVPKLKLLQLAEVLHCK